ncbi:F0F1 ATP synthase subunit alpha, partial [bacterium]|nr:F0F1 ATP synthase subunit alpha [bacterium]
VPLGQVKRCENEMMRFFTSNGAAVLKAITEKKKLDEELEAQLKKLTEDFKETFSIEA